MEAVSHMTLDEEFVTTIDALERDVQVNSVHGEVDVRDVLSGHTPSLEVAVEESIEVRVCPAHFARGFLQSGALYVDALEFGSG